MHQIKIQPEHRRTFTVRELARALDVRERELMDGCKAAGEYVCSPHARLEEPAARKVTEHLGKLWPFSDPEPQPVQTPPAPPAMGLRPAKPQPRRDNHPLMQPQPRPRDLPWRPPRDVRPRPPRTYRPAPPPPSDPIAQAFLEPASDAEVFRDYWWSLRGFTDVEKDEWIACGLLVGQAKLAAKLRDAGLVPTDLLITVDGVMVRARLRRGDGVAAVLRLLGRASAPEQTDEAM